MSDNGFSAAALRAYLAQRCQRAYLHEMRNSLQGIYTGFEVLARISADNPAIARAREVTRNAIANHERGMQQVLMQLIQPDEQPSGVALDTLLQETRSFLNNDAAMRETSLRATAAPGLRITSRPLQLRMAVVGTAVYFIDTLRGGEIVLSATQRDDLICVEVLAKGAKSESTDVQEWLLSTLAEFVQTEGGEMTTDLSDARQRSARICYRAAIPLAADDASHAAVSV